MSLPTWTLPREAMNVYRANPGAQVTGAYLPADEVVFCIHPQLLDHSPGEAYVDRTLSLGAAGDPISASPSSSTRTLFVGGGNHALKVHFPFRISRYGRRMRDEVVEQAVAVSAILEAWPRARSGDFAFLREVLGITHRDLEPASARGENWGYLVRDMSPFPALPVPGSLVPGFALYGQDRFDPHLPPLVFDLVGDADSRDWLLENLFLPVVRDWVACYRELGLILEPHGQNLLLEVDGEGGVRRVVHRDLSVGIDMRRRRDLGLPDGALNAYNRMEDGAFASIAYDRFMGGHFFDALLVPVLKAHPRVSEDDVRGPCRDLFTELFPDHEAYLPRTVHYFSEARDQFGKPHSVDTGVPPVWRP